VALQPDDLAWGDKLSGNADLQMISAAQLSVGSSWLLLPPKKSSGLKCGQSGSSQVLLQTTWVQTAINPPPHFLHTCSWATYC